MPEGLPEIRQAICVNEWALYLQDLGRLNAAARCFERYIEWGLRKEDWKSASIGNRNLTDALILAGRLTAASEAAEAAVRLAMRADDSKQRSYSYVSRAHIRSLRGETSGALADFRKALHWQHQIDGEPALHQDCLKKYWEEY